MSLRWMEAEGWVQKRLSNLSAAGEDRTRLPAAGGGQTDAVVRWRFDPV